MDKINATNKINRPKPANPTRIKVPRRLFKYLASNLVYKMSKAKHLLHKNFKIPNEYNQLLHGTVINNRSMTNQVCVVFMHGYGSNKLQGLTLVELLPKDLDFCCFDFSASGRSQGNTTIFGLKQYRDLCNSFNYPRCCHQSFKVTSLFIQQVYTMGKIDGSSCGLFAHIITLSLR